MNINDNEITVTCRLCGEQVKRVYGKHLKFKHDNISTKEYKKMFPGAPIMAKSDLEKTSKNSGNHMKTEKYKQMFSEMLKGEKNPMHRSKTTEEFRKKQSPFSKEFYKSRYPEMSDQEIEEKIKEVSDKAIKDRLLPSNREYWMLKGYTKSQAEEKVSESQRRFSKDICIEKYGEEKGLEVWIDRQEKWHKNYKKSNFSKISQELYISIYNEVKNNFNDIYFATLNEDKIDDSGKNHEYRLRLNDKYILPDFYIPSINKIIEFDGTYYHRETPENKKRERERDISIKENNIEVLHISESEYRKNKEKTIKKCIDFLYEANN